MSKKIVTINTAIARMSDDHVFLNELASLLFLAESLNDECDPVNHLIDSMNEAAKHARVIKLEKRLAQARQARDDLAG